jgi:hypothetical protein
MAKTHRHNLLFVGGCDKRYVLMLITPCHMDETDDPYSAISVGDERPNVMVKLIARIVSISGEWTSK